ncbi:MAG: hypothetical protein IT467_05320 [Dokdonella sp.]|nr:hypothetical protein [Dokdonella sp.]
MSGSTAPPDSRHPRAASAQVQARAALVRNPLRNGESGRVLAMATAGPSLLQWLEHGKWIAPSRDDYVARAIAAASQIDSNRAHRARLREQVRKRLCDGPAQALDMATTIRELWRRACA